MVDRPPIPATCAHRPTIGGLVKPWVNVELADGGIDFRGQHRTKTVQSINGRLCQVCGTRLRHPIVLLGGPEQLQQLVFGEPPLHPECAVYTSRACPMVAGRMTEYPDRPRLAETERGQTCPTPGCDCGGWTNHDPSDRTNRPAYPWYAVYVAGYTPMPDQNRQLLVVVDPAQVLTVRLVSEPGRGRRWTTMPDALAGYQPPRFATLTGGEH